MTGPNLLTPKELAGHLPQKLRTLAAATPKDLYTIVEWVLLNFAPNEGSATNPPGGGGGTDCMAVLCPPPGSGTWVAGSISGSIQWIDTTQCNCNTLNGGSA